MTTLSLSFATAATAPGKNWSATAHCKSAAMSPTNRALSVGTTSFIAATRIEAATYAAGTGLLTMQALNARRPGCLTPRRLEERAAVNFHPSIFALDLH